MVDGMTNQNLAQVEAGYHVQLSVNCEPWFVIDRATCPLYDARFRGYGWNKVTSRRGVARRGVARIIAISHGLPGELPALAALTLASPVSPPPHVYNTDY